MKKLFAMLLPLVAAVPSSVSAQPLMNYTYADVAYQWTHFDQSGLNDSNGLDVKLSYSPIEHFALEGGYNYLKTKGHVDFFGDRVGFDVDQNLFTYGGAGWYTVSKGLDLVGRVGGIHAQASISAEGVDDSTSDNGVYAGLVLRYLAMEELETDLSVTYDYIESSDWTYALTGLYAVHENVALKGEVGIDNDSNLALLGGIRLAM